MRTSRVVALLVAVALGSVLWLLVSRRERVLYVGGPILTMDATNRVVEALAVDGERIAAVGTAAELRRWADEGARVVDLKGRALIPGFIDAHSHFPGAGLSAVMADLNSPPIGTVRSIGDVVERLREQASRTSGSDWVAGFGYDDSLLTEKRHPTRTDLDRASSQHLIAIMHISGHLAAVNSRALEHLGITRDTPDPDGGRIRRDAETGEPNGVLEETAAEEVMKRILRPSLLDALKILRRANELYLAAGVTTAQNGYASARDMQTLAWASRLGGISMRFILWPNPEATVALLDGSFTFRSPDELWVRRGAAKLIADGTIQGYTGYLGQPYHVPPGDDPGYRGYRRTPRNELIERVVRYHTQGWQVAVHGNGDAAIDDILDAFEAAQRAQPRKDARPVIVHAQMAREDQLDRMQRLGAIPSFFVLHTYYWGDRHRDIFMGPERAARISPARSAVERGMHFTFHADTPVVPMEPLRIVWAAVNRRSTSGAVIGEAQRIEPMLALRAVTIDAAYQYFEEQEKGSIEAGKLADLVILDRWPLQDPEHIDQIRVLETIIGGKTVYRAGS